jgi:hypothetical protein
MRRKEVLAEFPWPAFCILAAKRERERERERERD